MHLEATGIHVLGALRAGSATCRLDTRMTITLHGSRPSTRADLDALSFSTKGIHVSGSGALELHGRLYHRTWARLARSVQPGDTSVRLQRAVNWEAGQEVVLTTTAIKEVGRRLGLRPEDIGQVVTQPRAVAAAQPSSPLARRRRHARKRRRVSRP